MKNKIIIIGGGAAGFFAAIRVAETSRNAEVIIVEKTSKLLSKVRVSGGGRCNVTHHCFVPVALAQNYPRGNKELKQLFKKFQAKDTVEWFANRGVVLKTEADGRMFPTSDSSQTIIDCFMDEVEKLGIQIMCNCTILKIEQTKNGLKLHSDTQNFNPECSQVVIATGGNPMLKAYQWLESTQHTIVNPIPSLFTFNDKSKYFSELMGLSVSEAEVKIVGTKMVQSGPLLITHWGLSGPAVIKLSAWAAEHLHTVNYEFTALVSWIGTVKEEEIRQQILAYKTIHPKQNVLKNNMFAQIPMRLWLKLCAMAEIPAGKLFGEMSNKQMNKLLENLIRCPFEIKGKTTFKEEFVTCGGVPLHEIDLEKMESKLVPNLFFAGEVLHIDGITGGFNFQAAWTTAWVAANGVLGKENGI